MSERGWPFNTHLFRFLRLGKEAISQRQEQADFDPEDEERSIVDVMIDNRHGVSFKELRVAILEDERIMDSRKDMLIEQARQERGRRIGDAKENRIN